MPRKMIAEVTIGHPHDLNWVCAVLIEHEFHVELGDCGDKDIDVIAQLDARILSELNDSRFRSWVTSMVEPFGGKVTAVGPAPKRDRGWVIELSRRYCSADSNGSVVGDSRNGTDIIRRL